MQRKLRRSAFSIVPVSVRAEHGSCPARHSSSVSGPQLGLARVSPLHDRLPFHQRLRLGSVVGRHGDRGVAITAVQNVQALYTHAGLLELLRQPGQRARLVAQSQDERFVGYRLEARVGQRAQGAVVVVRGEP